MLVLRMKTLPFARDLRYGSSGNSTSKSTVETFVQSAYCLP